MKRHGRLGAIFAALILCLGTTGCGGGGAAQQSPPPPPSVSVSVSPAAATVDQGGIQNFTAPVTGTTNTAVTWSVQEGAAGGAISSAGAYTAPQAAGTYHVIATSQADNTKSAMATVTVPPVAVAIAPTAATVFSVGTQSFTAMVTGTNNTAVTWSVQEGIAGGSVDTMGDYVAPANPGTYHVIATSIADNSAFASAAVTVVGSGFLPTGNMTAPRTGHTATLLPNGTVLVAGGFPDLHSAPVTSAEIYDPAVGSFSSIPAMARPRGTHTATLLANGTVLIAGGGVGPDNSAELFDPVPGTFALVPAAMNAQRNAHTATLLPNGQVLLAGGVDNAVSTVFDTAETYDPATGRFILVGNMTSPRWFHTATLLNNGKVLITGGFSDLSEIAVQTGEIFDPATGTFTSAGTMVAPRGTHTATLLPNGAVLVAGGIDVPDPSTTVLQATAELFNAGSIFVPTGSMLNGRYLHTSTLLSNGTVLVAGGSAFLSGPMDFAELYDPGSGSFISTGSLSHPRFQHTATRLNNGDVLVTGGFDISQKALASAEIYH